MSILNVTGSKGNHYSGYAGKTDRIQEPFEVEVPEMTEEENSDNAEASDTYKGKSFMDLLAGSGLEGMKANQIPVINQIVSSKNPEDGKIYRAYFMDDKIFCDDAEGKRTWEIAIDDAEQGEKVKDFFKKYTPYKWAGELYSGKDMEMAVLESFWRDLFGKA